MSLALRGGSSPPLRRRQLLRLARAEPAAGRVLGSDGQHNGSLAVPLDSGHLEEGPVFLQLGSGKSFSGN